MSNPVDIETAGEPAWLRDDSSPARATPDDDVIRAPTRAFTTTGRQTDAKKKKEKKSFPTTKSTGSDANTDIAIAIPIATAIPAATNANANANANSNVNVNNGANNNMSNAEAARQLTWGQYFKDGFKKDGRLLLITLAILIGMNIPYVRHVLYPFEIFSTWIHELCHGVAALMLGGKIYKLEIFPDTSGLAYSGIPNGDRRGFVAAAGYQGTAIVGFLFLVFRRTKRGPRTGTMIIACTMLLSCILWVRNPFGFLFIFGMGLVLAGLAWWIPSTYIRNIYIFIAITVCLNAITSIQNLFGSNQMVNGEPSTTDAHTMEEYVGLGYIFWAILWLVLAIVLTLGGIMFAIPGPDEVADFACCGVCQDIGCFKLVNYPGQRWWRRMLGNNNANGDGSGANTTGGP
jgi:hypothetical protein